MKDPQAFSGSPETMRAYEEELDKVEQQLQENPEDIKLLLKKAHLLFLMGFYEECLSLCHGIGATQDRKWEFALLEASCENWIYKREKILSRIREFAPIPREYLFSDLGTILGIFCDVGDSIYYLTNLLKKEQNERIWYLLGRLHRADGRLKEALGCIEKALGISKNFGPALKLKEKIRVEILRGATRAAKTGGYLESVPVQEARAGFSAEDWFVRGLGNIRANNYNAALKSFAEALKCETQFHVCWYFAGKAQEKLGGENKARQCYKKFIEGFGRSSGYYREKLIKSPPDADRRYLEGLYQRWIGFFPEDQRSWIAYLKYLADINDIEALRLLASEILARQIHNWFIDRASPQFHVIKGMLELCLGRTRSARTSFNAALKSKSIDNIALLGIGKSYEYIGNFKEAEEYYRKVAKLKGSATLGLYEIVNINLLRQSEKDAVRTIDEALKMMANSILLKGKRAEILLKFSDLKGFMEYFTSIVNKEYLHIHLDLMKSLALYKAHRYDEAIWEVEAAKTRNPGNLLILKSLGMLYLNTGRYQKVPDIIEEMRKIRDFESEIFLLQGISYYYAGEYQQSLEFLESYMNLCPLDPRVWTYLAILWFIMGNHDISERSFIKAHELANGVSYPWLNLAIFYCNRGEYGTTARCLTMVEEEERQGLHYDLCQAKCWRTLGKTNEVIKIITEVLKNDPGNVPALILSCMAKFEEKAYQECYDIISKALEVDSTKVELLYAKGVILIYLGDSNSALEAINKVLEMKPDFYDAWLAKAVLYWSISDLKEAGEALKGAQNLKPREFGEWLRYASSQKDHLSAIKLDIPFNIPFAAPSVISIEIDDPVNIFKYDKLDNIFK